MLEQKFTSKFSQKRRLGAGHPERGVESTKEENHGFTDVRVNKGRKSRIYGFTNQQRRKFTDLRIYE